MRTDGSINTLKAYGSKLGAPAAAVIAGMMMVAAATPAQAFTDQLNDLFQEFHDCKILMFTNPAEHARLCLGDGAQPDPFKSLSTLQQENAPQPTPLVVEEEPEEEEEEETDPCAVAAVECEEEEEEKVERCEIEFEAKSSFRGFRSFRNFNNNGRSFNNFRSDTSFPGSHPFSNNGFPRFRR